MDSIVFETKIEFTEDNKHITPAGHVFQALSGAEQPKEGRPDEPGVRIRDEKKKLLVLWGYNSCSVLVEDEKEANNCISKTIAIFEKIDNSVKIGELRSISLGTSWILPVKGMNFKELELKYRSSFFKEQAIFNKSIDSSVVMDMKQENCTMHHQSGAMGIKQLKDDYKIFEFTGYKEELFIFLLVNIINTNVLQYSRESIKEFLSWSYEKSYNHAGEFSKIIEVGL